MMCLKQPKTSLLITIIIALIVLDQMTKQIAEVLLVYARPVEVLPFLDWTLLYNRGAAFSFLSDAGGWQRWFFLAISVVMSVVFAVWLSRTPKEQALMRYSLALIIAGAIGNLIDRAYLGHVIDFISVHWQNTHYFPAFNIADSAITIGTLLMMLDIILQPKSAEK